MIFRKIDLSDTDLIEDYKLEFIKNCENINGAFGLDKYETSEWINKILNNNENKKEFVPRTTLIAISKKSKKMLGIVNIRHYLNENLLKNGGHIGYSVRKCERNKGIATKILNMSLKECKKLGLEKVLLTCNIDNVASKKVIEKNNGVLEKIENNKMYFWIKIC